MLDLKQGKELRRMAATNAKKENIRLLGVLLGNAIMTPGEGVAWFGAVDRAKSMEAQETLTLALKDWISIATDNAKAKAFFEKQNAELERQIAELKR